MLVSRLTLDGFVLDSVCHLLILAKFISKLMLASVAHCWHSRGEEERQAMHLGACINVTSFGFSQKNHLESLTQKSFHSLLKATEKAGEGLIF